MASISENKRLKRALGVAFLLGIILVIVFARFYLSRDKQESSIARGMVLLSKGIKGDKDALKEAESQFREAARDTWFDPYPFFVLSVTGKLVEREVPDQIDVDTMTPDAKPEIVNQGGLFLISKGRLDEAQIIFKRIIDADPENQLARLYLRLLTDLQP